jgi:xylan 1,4-beta-xylosidase
LQFTPGHPAYSADVKITLTGGARAGFLLFYGTQFYRGLEAGPDSLSQISDKRSTRVTALAGGASVYLRIVNDNQTLALYYSFDGKRYDRVWDAADISPYTGNLLGNFRSLKLAVYSYGSGSATFSGFRYSPIIRNE